MGLLKHHKEKLNKQKPKIVFNTVLTNKNFDKILDIIKLAYDVKCEDITFIPLIEFDENLIPLYYFLSSLLKKRVNN